MTLLAFLSRRPSRSLAVAVCLAATAAWLLLRLVLFRDFVFPLTYALPLLLGVWTRDKALTWSMAVVFALAHTLRTFWAGPVVAYEQWLAYLPALVNILVAGLIVHLIIVLRARVESALENEQGANTELRAQEEELQAQAEELARQNEELSQLAEELADQSEELSRQTEELAGQNEELQAQTEEIQGLNTELLRREGLMQRLLDSARLTRPERSALRDICDAALEMFEGAAAAVVVYELNGAVLELHAAAGFDESEEVTGAAAANGRFAELVIEQNRTASLNDCSLRPDLSILMVRGRPAFRSALAAPMREGSGRAFGAVSVYGFEPREWTAEQFRVAEWLAGQSSHILETLRLQNDMRRQAQMIDLTPDAILVRKTDGTITHWGHGAESMYGWTREEAIGATTHTLLKTQFPRPLEQIVEELERAGRWTGDLTHATRDGRQVVVESRWLGRRNAQGVLDEILESNVDVTDRRRAEESLKEADRRKSEFLATLSHELRNPLAPIRYALDALQRRDERRSARALDVIARQFNHLARLVDDLLDATRIESNKIRLRKERVTLAAAVQPALEASMPVIEQAHHRLDVSLPPEPVWLDADADRLAQVFTNLLNNAARYTPEGGRIGLEATVTDGHVEVSVTDTGVGLNAEDLGRVFEMFAQVGDRGRAGLGIGLALIRGLVDLHGGTVEARSEGAGRGSQFVVRLPIVSQPDTTADSAADTTVAGAPCRVLVVDDNTDAADMVKVYLETLGHDVRVAYNGRTALETAARFAPDVAVLDIGMPGMSGYELARRLREDQNGRALYLVALTGWGQDEDRRRARDAGFDAHLTKPADPDEIQRIIVRATTCSAQG